MIYGQKAVEARQKAMAAAENVKQNIEFWNNVKQNIADRAPKAEVEEETGAAEVESEVKEEPKAEPKAEVETETETKAEPENEPKAKGKAKEKAETKAEEKAVSNTEGKVIEHALGIVEKLNYPKDKVHVIGSTDELRKAGKKGLADDVDAAMASGSFPTAWVETESGEVYLYAEGIKAAGMTEKDIEGTIYHEVIAHVGVRQLLGSKAGAFYKKVWSGMARVDQVRFTKYLAQSDNRPEYMELLKKYADGAKMSKEEKALFDELVEGAADEYVAYLAENVDKVENRNALQAIVDYIRKVLAKVFANVDITDEDIYTLLAASKRKMEKNGENKVRFSRVNFQERRQKAIEDKGTVPNGLDKQIVNIVDVAPHDFKGTGYEAIKAAKKWAKNNLVGDYKKSPVGEYTISSNAIDKYVSSSAVKKSNSLGVHLATMKQLPTVIENSILGESHADYTKVNGSRKIESPIADNIIHRLYGSVRLDGSIYRVKTTMREFADESKSKPHSFEVTEIELIDTPMALPQNETESTMDMIPTNSIVGAKLLKGVEKSYDKGVLLLDASSNTFDNNAQSANNKRDSKGLNDVNEGEVKTITDGKRRFQIVWHGSGADFEKFDSKFFLSGEGSMVYGAGHYVSNVEGTARLYATTAVAGHIKRTEAINKAQEEVYKKQREESEIVLQLDKKYNKAWNTKDAEEKHKDDAEYKLLLSKLDAARRGLSVAEQDLTKTIHEANPRHLYQIEIPDDNGKNYIDWNEKVGKPLIEKVKNGLLKAAEGNSELDVRDMEYLGLEDTERFNDLYGTVGTYLGGDKQASEFFNNLGFVGIKVPTGNMKGGDGRGMNYVIFNDDDLKIKGHTRFQRKGIVYLNREVDEQTKEIIYSKLLSIIDKADTTSIKVGNNVYICDHASYKETIENRKDGDGFGIRGIESYILNPDFEKEFNQYKHRQNVNRRTETDNKDLHNHRVDKGQYGNGNNSTEDRTAATKVSGMVDSEHGETTEIQRDIRQDSGDKGEVDNDKTRFQRVVNRATPEEIQQRHAERFAKRFEDIAEAQLALSAFVDEARQNDKSTDPATMDKNTLDHLRNILQAPTLNRQARNMKEYAKIGAMNVKAYAQSLEELVRTFEKMIPTDAESTSDAASMRSAVNMDVLENEAEYEGKTRFQFKKHQNADGVLLYDDAFDNVKLYTDFDSVELEGADYGGLMYTINNNYYGKHEGKRISIEHFSPSGRNKKSIFAVFENYGFNKYRFIVKGEYDDAKVRNYEILARTLNEEIERRNITGSPSAFSKILDTARIESGLSNMVYHQSDRRRRSTIEHNAENIRQRELDGGRNSVDNNQGTERNGSGGIDTRFQRVVNRATPEEIQQRHAERFAKRFEDIAEAQLALSAFVDEARQNDKSTDPATMDKNTLDHLRNILQAPTLNRQARNMKEYAKIGAMNVKAYAQSLEELVRTFEKMIPTDAESTSDAASMRSAIEKAISICRMACWLRGRGCLMRRDWNGLYHVFVKVAGVQQLSCK